MYRALSPGPGPKGRPRKLVRTQVAGVDGSGFSLLPARALRTCTGMPCRSSEVGRLGKSRCLVVACTGGAFPQLTRPPRGPKPVQACPGGAGAWEAQLARGQRSLEWAKGQHPKSLKRSGTRVTDHVLGLSTSAQGPLVRASLSTSAALLPQKKGFRLLVISHQGPGFLLLALTTLVWVTAIHN